MCERMNKINFYFILLISGIFISGFGFAQHNPEVKAIQYFNSGNYTESEILFQQLLEKNPTDPMYNYYYGASRTENGHYGEKELEYLTIAEKHFTPERLFYYLGIQHHARQNWSQALKYYNKFKMSIPEEEQIRLEVNNKIQLCFNQENPYAAPISDIAPTEEIEDGNNTPERPTFVSINMDEGLTASTDPLLTTAEETDEVDEDLYLPRSALPNLPGVKATLPAGEQIKFQIDDYITYYFTSQFQTSEGGKLFKEAYSLQKQQENKLKEADRLRNEYKLSENQDEKNEISSKIMLLERESFQLEEKIRQTFVNSREIEKLYWNNADAASRNNFLIEQENILARLSDDNKPRRQEEEILLMDFEAPKPSKPEKNNTNDRIYKIQISAYMKGIPTYKQPLFKKLAVIRTIENYTDEKGVVVYTTGNLTKLDDALKMQHQVRQEGIQDAKVVPYIDGKRITLEQAKQLEAENDI